MGKGQVWSLDLVIGMLVFLLAIGTIYSFMIERETLDPTLLRIESEVVAQVLTTGGNTPALQVAEHNQLDMEKLGDIAALAELDYAQLKKEFGIEHDFCIYLQDEDDNLIFIRDSAGNSYAGIGPATGDLNITINTPCGTKIT